MNCTSYFFLPLCLILLVGCSHNQHSNQQNSPYAGQETREIKALSTQEIDGYLNGRGMGLSKVAELNKYPGPKHVLELADQLELSDQQREQTEALFNQMKKKAVDMGEAYIAKERELNKLFESEEVSSSSVDSMLVEIGKIKGSLRAVHIKAHIKMRDILTSGQIKKYDNLRGYGKGDTSHAHQNHS
ncbi:MAG: hypothetical protein U5J95_03520 [Balneolaceae bacterium]|nr:hypothetical protein [Balneolaceae bacterium]